MARAGAARTTGDQRGRQAALARLLRAIDVRLVDPADGRRAGELLGMTGTKNAIDATVVLLAGPGYHSAFAMS